MSIYDQKSAKAERWADKPTKQYQEAREKEEKVRINLMIPKSSYDFILDEVSELQKEQGKPYPISTYIRDILDEHIQRRRNQQR